MTAQCSHIMEGGLRIGRSPWLCFTFGWPSATLEIWSDRLVVAMIWRRYTFTLPDITRLSFTSGIRKPALQIEHRIHSYPRYMAFTTYHTRRLAHSLIEAGYPVDDANA